MQTKFTKRLFGLVAAPVILLGLSSQSNAAVSCACDTTSCGIIFNNVAGGGNINPGSTIVNGTQVRATVQIAPQAACNGGGTPCEFHHGAVMLTHPDGFVETLTTDLGTTTGAAAPLVFTSTHVDTFTTSGTKVYTMTYGNPSNPLPDALDGSWITGTGDQLGASATCAQALQVVSPRICITKQCANACTPIGQAIPVSGDVTNCGDEYLGGVNVTDVPPITLTFTRNGATITAPFTLVAGAVVHFTGSYTPSGNACGPFTDTATAIGTGVTTGTVVSNSASATCCVCTAPAMTITKDCFKVGTAANPVRTLVPGDSFVETFSVKNTGDVAVNNVTIHDTKGGVTTDIACSASLAPGDTCTFTTQPTTVSAADCGHPITDSATASGINACGTGSAGCPASPGSATAGPVTCTITVVCQPGLTVEKDVVCIAPNAACPPENDPGWAKVAVGVFNPITQEYPAFCYRFKVCNTSSVDFTITSVSDLVAGTGITALDLASCGFVGGLVPANTCTAFCVKSTTLQHDITNVFTACLTFNGTNICAHDTNRVHLIPVGITCAKYVSDNGGTPVLTDGANSCLSLDGSVPHSLQYSVTICNSGEVPLAHVTYSDPTLGIPVTGDYSLAPGQCTNVNVGSPVTNAFPNGIRNTITVHGVVDTSGTTACAYKLNGTLIDASSQCSACVSCTAPGSCRTTGGGKQDQAVTSHLLPNKPINVDPRANPLQAKFVTHGGQVGAPVGTATEWDPESPCIKGEWEHVRHFRPGLDGNFHARKFDSLQCACLACLGDPGSGTVVPGKKGGLCNPGDRFCGPEPRRAPANKMCFSGVGNYTIDNGRNGHRTPDSVAFRVDIEDHSEPGGSGPKGNKRLPADRYRIRIYKFDGDKNSAANVALRIAIACTKANTPLRDGTTDPLAAGGVTTDLGSAFPPGSTYVPYVDDGGELDKGNRQIHPQIKQCP